ncbi:MAG: hypothetical protein DRP94_08480 [Candidatus Latescibacterota bacterium]|nr:MAG: hypothetical protein DRP94_08480 [Candidatus Latescibacterota bacterium]
MVSRIRALLRGIGGHLFQDALHIFGPAPGVSFEATKGREQLPSPYFSFRALMTNSKKDTLGKRLIKDSTKGTSREGMERVIFPLLKWSRLTLIFN